MKNVNKSYKVVVFKGQSGEHHALLVDEAGFPDWWSARWVVEKLRQIGQASSTVSGLCCTNPQWNESPLTPDGFMPQAPSQDGPVG